MKIDLNHEDAVAHKVLIDFDKGIITFDDNREATLELFDELSSYSIKRLKVQFDLVKLYILSTYRLSAEMSKKFVETNYKDV